MEFEKKPSKKKFDKFNKFYVNFMKNERNRTSF